LGEVGAIQSEGPLSSAIPATIMNPVVHQERDGVFAIAGLGVLALCWFAYRGAAATISVTAGHFFST